MTAILEVTGVSRRFGDTVSLDDVTFQIPAGSICGLFGHNGAGKTTLLSIIAGQDRPDAGTVRVNGAEPFENGDVLGQMNYIRDNQRYPDDYTVRHILRASPLFYENWDAALAERLIERFALPRTQAVKKFSRGQLSATAIIVGLASRAELTLFDEPYLGLDVAARQLFYTTLLEEMAHHPRTVLLSTHLVQEAEALFSHVVILDHGRVVLDAPRDDLWDYATTIAGVRTAVDALPLDGRVLSESGTGALLSRTVRGALTEAQRAEADRLGLVTAPASLQELVGSLSSASPTPTTSDALTIGR